MQTLLSFWIHKLIHISFYYYVHIIKLNGLKNLCARKTKKKLFFSFGMTQKRSKLDLTQLNYFFLSSAFCNCVEKDFSFFPPSSVACFFFFWNGKETKRNWKYLVMKFRFISSREVIVSYMTIKILLFCTLRMWQ